MSEAATFIASGIMELYVMGHTSGEENARVEDMAARYPEIKQELEQIEMTLGDYAWQHAVAPDPTLKPFIMATIDYMERIGGGEIPAFPPELHAGSRIEDYHEWLQREDLQLQQPLREIQARIIGYTPQMTTAIVWIENGSPPETHTDEYEKFLIIEGTCNIIVGDTDNHLKAGDMFPIPLHISHTVIVTSDEPCKIILQRVAA